jgi:hypothetical protein
MYACKRWFVRYDHPNCLRLGLRHVERNDCAAAIAENERGCLAGGAQHGYRVATLLADVEILGIVHRTASIGTAVVSNDFELIRENICNR